MSTTSTLGETLIAETMDLITRVYSDHVISRSLLHGTPKRSMTNNHTVDTEPIKEGLRKFFKDAQSDAEKESANLKERMNDMEKAQESVCRQTERAVGSMRSLAELVKKMLQDSCQDNKKREQNARDLEKHMIEQQHILERMTNTRVIKMGKFMAEQYNKGLVNILGYGISFANALGRLVSFDLLIKKCLLSCLTITLVGKDLFSQAIINAHIEEASEAQGEKVEGINEEIDEDLLSLEVDDILQADDLNTFSHGKVEISHEAWQGEMMAIWFALYGPPIHELLKVLELTDWFTDSDMDLITKVTRKKSRDLDAANTFANGSNTKFISPDPWATFGQQSQQDDLQVEGYASPFENSFVSAIDNGAKQDRELTESHASLGNTSNEREVASEHSLHTLRTSPDKILLNDSDSGLQSPGFLDSILTEDEPSAEPLSAASSSGIQIHTARTSPSITPTHSPSLETAAHETASPNLSFFSPLPLPPIASSHFVSPLQYSNNGMTKSFASLALGGESAGGWQDSLVALSGSLEHANYDATMKQPEETESKTSLPEEKESSSSEKQDLAPQPHLSISVEDPQKVGDAIRPYMLYTVHTKTNLASFEKPSFSVLRRYSDFLWLYETLSMNNPGVFVPPVPEKNSFGRFDSQFVQQRRLALEKCVQKIANHPVLVNDSDLRMFLESDTFALDIRHRKTELTQERGGLMSSIGQTITGPKFYEVDEWFDKKKSYLDGLESQLRSLVKSVDTASKQRAELAIATSEFARAIGELSESDLSKQLSHSLVVISDVEKKAQDLQYTQSQEDTITLMSTAEEYARIINSVRVWRIAIEMDSDKAEVFFLLFKKQMAFSSRIRCYSRWQNAEGELWRMKQAHEKARGQGRIPQDRVGYSLVQIADAERKVVDAKQDFERCSKLIKSEMARFEEERICDFKNSLETFLEGMIQRQKELISSWESYQDLLLKKVNAVQYVTNS
ncbi:hypothetical protein EW145_g3462 [Phellinidium pouzarii]|uniref:PX domain-containing protein n=1 Tax=Phellinidium pouzarii TaxID=167371 RepID=A0A4S4L708_9AGAM|nr:hypothetical protein EW145_g3462 [Phellinidium pouzarii]